MLDAERRVLVVDDDPDIRNLIFGLLIEEGDMVTVAQNGRQALDLLSTRRVDLILLDLAMP